VAIYLSSLGVGCTKIPQDYNATGTVVEECCFVGEGHSGIMVSVLD